MTPQRRAASWTRSLLCLGLCVALLACARAREIGGVEGDEPGDGDERAGASRASEDERDAEGEASAGSDDEGERDDEAADERAESGELAERADEVDVAVRGDDSREDYVDEVGRELTYWGDIKPIIDAKCTTCHFDGGIAPMALTTYAEIEPYIELIGYDVREEIMPPWTADMPYDFFLGDRRLTSTQQELVLEWVEQGGPEGDSSKPSDLVLEQPVRALERVDLTLSLPEAYEPQINPDDYRCFVLEWPLEETTYITGLSIEPDQTDIVHHAIVYHVQPEDAQAAFDNDAEEDGPGYTCFGVSGTNAAWLQSYEPGGYAQGIPGDLGFEVRPGSVMVLQIHYNTLNGSAADRSGIDFTLADEVDRVGEVVLFMRPTWAAGFMPIGAGDPEAVHSYQGRPFALDNSKRYELFWVDLHMHALGSQGGIGIVRAASPGRIEPLLYIPEWDFAWQETYMFREPVVLEPGDQLYLECRWDNSQENQIIVGGEQLPTRDVNWGDGTTDEMCLGNVLAAPL